MDARNIIEELSLLTDEIESYLNIMDDAIIELDQKTSNIKARNAILKIIGKLYVVWKNLVNANIIIDKSLNNSLWKAVLILEEKATNKK